MAGAYWEAGVYSDGWQIPTLSTYSWTSKSVPIETIHFYISLVDAFWSAQVPKLQASSQPQVVQCSSYSQEYKNQFVVNATGRWTVQRCKNCLCKEICPSLKGLLTIESLSVNLSKLQHLSMQQLGRKLLYAVRGLINNFEIKNQPCPIWM